MTADTSTSAAERYARMSEEIEELLSDMKPRIAMFCREYFILLNATSAAQNAGYKGSRNTLSSVGYDLLSRTDVAKVMDLFFDRNVANVEIDQSLLRREYWKLYNTCLNKGNEATARACLKDLGESEAMFIKVVATADARELGERLSKGRERMNAQQARELGLNPRPVEYKAG